jgi:hypothetical protein
MAGFLIKSYHGDPKRVHFWQTPWVIECRPYLRENPYGELVECTSREIGGWVTWSGAATVYADPSEADAVSTGRRLFGEVVDASRYLQA